MKMKIWVILSFLALFSISLCQAQINPPLPPPTPPPMAGHLPIVLLNDSGYDNADVYCVLFGSIPGTDQICFVKFDATTGKGTLIPIALGQNSIDYSFTISQMPTYQGGDIDNRVIYLPHIVGSRLYFSLNKPLNMAVVETETSLGLGINTPNFTNQTDPNFATAFDWYEIAFGNDNVIGANGTGVDAFCLPLYGYISTPTEVSSTDSGVPISRSEMFQDMYNAIAANATNANGPTPEGAQWLNLITLYKNASVDENFRIISPFKASEITTTDSTNPQLAQFDPNYLDNETAYGFSYLKEIWYGDNAYYKTHDLYIEIPIDQIPGVRSRKHYNGRVNGKNQFVFTQVDRVAGSQNTVILKAPTLPSQKFPPKTTTQQIFGGEDLTESQLIPDSPDGIQCSKFLEELIVSGLAPLSRAYIPNLPPEQQQPLTEEFMNGSQLLFYKKNANLSELGQATGPWYSLYAKALHDFTFRLAKQKGTLPKVTPTTYAFAYDEPLWPQVLITSNNLYPTATDSRITFLGVTILNSTPLVSGDSVTIDIDSIANPAALGQTVTFTTTLTPNIEALLPPSGTVTFIIDGVATSPINVVDGKASYSTSSLSLGSHSVNVAYSGDMFFSASEGISMGQVIVGDYVTINITASSNPSFVKDNLVFTVGVLPSFQGDSKAKGNITLLINDIVVGQAPLKNQVAQINAVILKEGTYSIVAKYSGSKKYPAANSHAYAQTVVSKTFPFLTSSINPSQSGKTVEFTFELTDDLSWLPPTGNVFFIIDGKKVVSAPINQNGIATYKTSKLKIGKHTVISSYSGNGYYNAVASNPIIQVVNRSSDVFPPRHLLAKQVKKRYPSRTNFVNRLKWQAPKEGDIPILYAIYADENLTKLSGKVEANPFLPSKVYFFNDLNSQQGTEYTYYVVSINKQGAMSDPAFVKID